jgi:putative aldouronate transport system substrate-binding protein
MNDIGLLDPESFVQKYDHYAAKISSGRVVALNDQEWQFAAPQQALEAAGKYEQTYGYYPAQVSETLRSGDFINKGFSGGWGISITDNCKDPQRVFEFLDWMCSDEAQVLNYWGLEGTNYTVENGKRVRPQAEIELRAIDPEYTKKTGVGMYLYPFPYYGRGVLDPTGSPYDPTSIDTILGKYNDITKTVLSHYGAAMWRDLYPSAEEVGRTDPWGYAWQISVPDDGEISVVITKLLDTTKQYIAASVLAPPAQFDAVWSEFQGELRAAGVDRANQTMTRLVKERVELWN